MLLHIMLRWLSAQDISLTFTNQARMTYIDSR